MTMMMLGPVAFKLQGLNPTKYSIEGSVPFAKHKVIGSRPVKEYMGAGDEEVSISGTIYPFNQVGVGGLDGLQALKAARDAAIPLPLVRADGGSNGWFLIEEVKEEHESLSPLAIGREINFSAKLCSDAPPGVGMLAQVFNLFGF